MRHTSLRLLLSGCALLAFAASAAAQDAPVIVDPPLRDGAPVIVPLPGGDVIPPEQLRPPAVVPTDEPVPIPEPAPTPPPIPEIWAPVPLAADGQSAYGLYLAGRVASLRGEQALGADLLTRSQRLTPEQPQLGAESFLANLFSGDIDSVVRLSPFVAQDDLLSGAGRLASVVQRLRDGDGPGALALMNGPAFPSPYGPVSSYLQPAVAAAGGDWDTALTPVEAPVTELAGLILRDQRAQLLESRRRFAEAEAEYTAVLASPDGARLFRVHYGAFLERQGRKDEALAVYAAALVGESPDPRALAAGRRIRNGGRPDAAPAPHAIAADALAFAAHEPAQVGFHELSAIYLLLASTLDPDDSLTLRLGQSLAEANQDSAARAAFARVGPGNPIIYASAQLGLALNLQKAGLETEALEAFRRADAAAPGEVVVSRLLASQYFNLDRLDEALAVLDRPTVNTARQSVDVRFLRGVIYERMGRIEEAEAELWTALQASPDNPVLLNHLGYFWVDSGRRVGQGAEMIARAFAADPRNGNIQDSLGWAQYRLGQYDTAVETLEAAVAKQPANAEINHHLGDAYWQVGRRREAGWQWTRVLTLDPDAETRAAVERKLAEGLPAAAPTDGQP